MPGVKGPICRFENSKDPGRHSTYHYPFATLGPLVSHVKPQYVVVNAAQKLHDMKVSELDDLGVVLEEISSQKRGVAWSRLKLICMLYHSWTSPKIPRSPVRSAGDNRSNDGDQSCSEHPPHARSGEDQSDDDEESSDGEVLSPCRSKCRRQLQKEDVLPSSTQSSEDSVTEAEDWNPSEETAWTEEVCSWVQKCSEAAVSEGGWERGVFNEDQVAAYAKEHPCSVPPPESWHKWRPRWEKRPGRYPPFNTEKFSSND